MSYPGGKDGAGVSQRLINEIPLHAVFVSLCLGDCAVMRRKRPAPRNIGIDADPAVLRRWIERPEMEQPIELYQCDAVEWLRHQCGWYRVADSSVLGRAVRVADSGGVRSPDLAGWFLFADPPYLMAARRSPRRLYAVEPGETWHVDLVATLKQAANAGAMVMVTHYPHPLYGHGLNGWRTWTYQTVTRGGSVATEQVWCSYPVPAKLHDSRYLGRDKRERERIHRRVRNVAAKLRSLPALERQAVIDAIAPAGSPI